MKDVLKNFAVFRERGKCTCVDLASVERPSAKMAPFLEGLLNNFRPRASTIGRVS